MVNNSDVGSRNAIDPLWTRKEVFIVTLKKKYHFYPHIQTTIAVEYLKKGVKAERKKYSPSPLALFPRDKGFTQATYCSKCWLAHNLLFKWLFGP